MVIANLVLIREHEWCKDCGYTYIGRTLQHQIAEHKRVNTPADANISAVVEHAMERNHSIDSHVAQS